LSGRTEQELSAESPPPARRALGVGVIVIRGAEVLLGLRVGVHGGATWSVAGGGIDNGESPEAAARRELWEETGLDAVEAHVVAETDDVFPSGLRYRTFFVRVEGVVGEPTLREPEACERWGWFPWEALPQPLFLSVANLRATGFQP
jgi:8-oxo-dGTP diphosphatase